MFNFLKNKVFLFVLFFSGFIIPLFFVSAQYDLEKLCESGEWEGECNRISQKECEALCNQCLDYLNQKSAKIQQEILETGQKKTTLQNQIATINKKIKDIDYQIYQSNLSIKSLGFQMGDTEKSIEETSISIEDQKNKVIEILRAVEKEDKKPFFEILITSNTISQFFDNLIYLETLSTKNRDVLLNLQNLENGLKVKKVKLEEETRELKNLVVIQAIKKEESAQTKKEREYYLNLTEKEYQQRLAEKKEVEASAAQISARLFELVGEEGGGIGFGEAAKLAKYAESLTGVRAELILAIIHQESLFGHNVGQCYLTNFSNGSGTNLKGTSMTRVMSPTRDVPYFLEIVKSLGKDPKKTPVSCPVFINGQPFGWGGAMGPAQFIPSTWEGVRSDVDALLGRSANPWVIRDAFLASAVLLKKNGAISSPYNAACRYYSGSACPTGNTSGAINIRNYGNSIINKMNSFKKDLDVLEKSGLL